MELTAIADLLRAQDGVVSRRQVLARQGTSNDLARFRRRRELCRVHEGVFVDHTGPLTDKQRAWAAVLAHWPAVLCDSWSLYASRVRGLSLPPRVEVAVAHERRVSRIDGVTVRRIRGIDEVARWELSPPRTRLEHAVLSVASRAPRDDAAVAIVADVCQAGSTTPARLGEMLGHLPRLPRRAFLREVLDDTASGAMSALERRYLVHVERAHGLPTARRQRQTRGPHGSAFRDVEYVEHRFVVELDGRLGHEWSADTWDDLERDLVTAIEGGLTTRVGWRQVLAACRLAGAVAAILRARGWQGELIPCGPACTAVDRGASGASGAPFLPRSAS